MPIHVERHPCSDGLSAGGSISRATGGAVSEAPPRTDLTIGLLNNMKTGAAEVVERQFLSLLESASQGLSLRVQLYSLSEFHPGEGSRQNHAPGYSDIDRLKESRLDGLIVTGREPSTLDLRDEPYWESFVQILNWAAENTLSTIWSCLAAHAAVLHLDGIRRVPRTRKCSGVFECTRIADHPVGAGLPYKFTVPHSRWNGIDESRLAGCGYQVLTTTRSAGVDSFVRQDKSLFVFFQGHPEYEANTLLLEYRRDVGRYLRGESGNYPSIPHNYFDSPTTQALEELCREASRFPREELAVILSDVLQSAHVRDEWSPRATAIYSNWLNVLYSRKVLQSRAPGYARTDPETFTPPYRGALV